MKIQYSQSYSDRKSAYVESFNRTIQDLVVREREGTGGNPNRWINLWSRALEKYNFKNTHNFTNLTPFQAEQKRNQAKVKEKFDIKHAKVKFRPAKFKVGDIVRIYRIKGKFGRSYHQDFTNELFKIILILHNMPHPRYRLQDLNGETILGDFTEDLLSKHTL